MRLDVIVLYFQPFKRLKEEDCKFKASSVNLVISCFKMTQTGIWDIACDRALSYCEPDRRFHPPFWGKVHLQPSMCTFPWSRVSSPFSFFPTPPTPRDPRNEYCFRFGFLALCFCFFFACLLAVINVLFYLALKSMEKSLPCICLSTGCSLPLPNTVHYLYQLDWILGDLGDGKTHCWGYVCKCIPRGEQLRRGNPTLNVAPNHTPTLWNRK